MSLGWDVLQQPAYSPDVTPSDHHLFRSMQQALSDIHFQLRNEIHKWLDDWILSKDAVLYRDGIRHLPDEWLKVIGSNGDYYFDWIT